jgi:hypothetical protein
MEITGHPEAPGCCSPVASVDPDELARSTPFFLACLEVKKDVSRTGPPVGHSRGSLILIAVVAVSSRSAAADLSYGRENL